MKASKVTSRNVFRHKAISGIIKKQWFGPAQKDFTSNITSEEFRKVPDNLICLVCNAVGDTGYHLHPYIQVMQQIEVVLKGMIIGSDVPFTAKEYAPKYVILL